MSVSQPTHSGGMPFRRKVSRRTTRTNSRCVAVCCLMLCGTDEAGCEWASTADPDPRSCCLRPIFRNSNIFMFPPVKLLGAPDVSRVVPNGASLRESPQGLDQGGSGGRPTVSLCVWNATPSGCWTPNRLSLRTTSQAVHRRRLRRTRDRRPKNEKEPRPPGGGHDQIGQRGQLPWIFIIKGTISKATMLMILISGLTAGPAVSL